MPKNSRELTATWPLVLFLLLPALTRAETAVQAWVQRYNGLGSSSDIASAVAVDGSNNVIVTGSAGGSGGGPDYLTIKYSSAGVPLWTNRYNGPGNSVDTTFAVVVDGSNNVIVTGYSTGNGTGYDYATIQYSSAGVPLWTNRYNGPGGGTDQATAVAVDGSNNVIVTGYSGSGSGADYLTIQYSSAGVPLWTNRYNGPGNNYDAATKIAVDGSNNLIVTGGSVGGGGGPDYLTIKYSSAGVPLWTNRYNGPGNSVDTGYAVAVDGSNNVIVTGYSDVNGYGTNYDYATIKYSSAGVPLWTNCYDGPGNGDDRAWALAVDRNNNIVVTGPSYASGSGDDYATIKYSSAGLGLWTNRYNGPENWHDFPYALVVDGNNNVIVTGGSAEDTNNDDFATIKYSSAGAPFWTNRYNGLGNDYDTARAMAVDRSNNVIVTGWSAGSGGDYDFATVKYVSVPSPVMTNLIGANGTFQMRVDEVLQPGTLVIEVSTNLTGWAPVFTNTTPTNVLFYTDPDASNAPTRFYRAFQFR
jgi:hypothetical protein